MIRRVILGSLMAIVLVAAAGQARAQVSVSIGINLPGPPQLVAVPATPVMYAPGLAANYFYYGRQYFVFTNGVWYAGAGYNGPWVAVAQEYVPRPILAVPVQYYRLPPAEWRHWRREGPPQWAPAWGRHWKEGEGRREGFREERREDRREGHEDRRGGPRG